MTHRGRGSANGADKKKRDRNFVKVGNVRVRWYRSGDGRTFVDARPLGRKLVSFTDHGEALAEAERMALEINAGGVHSTALTGEDRAAYAHAKAEASKHGLDVTAAVSEWAEARRAIAESGRTLAEVVAAGVAAVSVRQHPLADVVAEMLQAKEVHDLQGRYLRGLKRTGEILVARFPGSIQSVGAAELEEFLDGRQLPSGERDGGLINSKSRQPVSARRRNNILKEVRLIFRFAQKRGYLPYDQPTEAHKVEIIRRVRSNIGVISPAVMRLYLAHVSDEFLPWVVINAFSGVRTEEIVLTKDAPKGKDPLRWEDFDWTERTIQVRTETSKTGHARPCPILDNLFAWLAPWRDAKATGPVCPGKGGKVPRPDHERVKFVAAARKAAAEMARRARDEGGELGIALDVSYPRNGFRHSYGSYRMAILRNEGQVAYEMGNSVAMIKRNYNNPRPASQARAWFGIFPDCRPANVLRFGSGGVA